ncbi:response regulator [Gilvibacter sp.]|uniref:response regulator n=1 Tax=Gilvibacter sp. TaxID=2729997 RepID=UPI003F49EFB5
MKKDISIVIADDHPMLLNGLFQELEANGYQVTGRADNGMRALELILLNKPSVALLDIDMPMLTGFEVVKMAKEKEVNTKFIVLSFHKEAEYVVQAKTLQIDGYLLKEDSFFEIERCIAAVMKGETYFSKSFGSESLDVANDELRKIKLLTSSELTILKLVAKQKSNVEISEMLNVSVRTIEKHRSNIIGKLELEKGTNMLTNWCLLNKKTILEH